MSSIIPAKDVGRLILKDLRDCAKREFPELNRAEREKLLVDFLNGVSRSMFMGPSK
jgi:hypothetical protein